MICKYFLPFIRLPFHFVDSFLYFSKAFWFDVVPLVYFCFCCLGFWSQIKKIIAKTYVQELITYVFFRTFMVSGPMFKSLFEFKCTLILFFFFYFFNLSLVSIEVTIHT